MAGLLRPTRQLLGLPSAWRAFQRSMFIEAHPTPNINSLKFHPGRAVLEKGTMDFPNARAAMASPLAKSLFRIEGVSSVFFGPDFVTITKKRDEVPWSELKPEVFSSIMDFYASGAKILADEASSAQDTVISEDDSEVVALIKELLDTRIRPAVQDDGGDIHYVSFDEDTGLVTVKLQGACSTCSSSKVTLKSGVENMLMHYVPEVTEVVAEEEEGEDPNDPVIKQQKKFVEEMTGDGAGKENSAKKILDDAGI